MDILHSSSEIEPPSQALSGLFPVPRHFQVDSCIRANREQRYAKPCEDYLLADTATGFFVICDGVTRTPQDGVYPSPSPAYLASRLFAESAHLAFLSQDHRLDVQVRLHEAFKAGNERINDLNTSLFGSAGIDYLARDLACTVAVIGVLADGVFHFAFIGDCFALHLTPHSSARLTRSQTLAMENYRRGLEPLDDSKWIHIRRDIRNSTGSPYSYGALTGEPSALNFLEFGSVSISPGDRIVLASDGLEDLLRRLPGDFRLPSAVQILARAELLEQSFGLRSDDKSLTILDFSR